MNDFERKLREIPLRPPPAAWRGEILAATIVNDAPHRSWRDHLWPPLPAWGALAAVWLVLFAVHYSTAPAAPRPSLAVKPPPSDALLAFHTEHALALLR